MDKRCENCKFHDDYTAVCHCSESIFRADFTPNGYVCDKWVECEMQEEMFE